MSPLANSIFLLALATIVGLLVTLFWKWRDRARETRDNKAKTISEEHSTLVAQVEALEKQLTILQTQMSPFWAAVQTKIAKDLTHPSPQFKEMDGLLRKLEALTITDTERVRLQQLLRGRVMTTDPEVSAEEKSSAKIMLEVIPKVVKEKADIEATVAMPQAAALADSDKD